MNWIDEKIKDWNEYKGPTPALYEWWIRIALQEARDKGYKEGALVQAEMDATTASQERERLLAQGAQEERAKIMEWVKENEYCSKCCSPKKFCPDWGKHASATDTTDLLHHLQQLKDNK